MLENENSPDYSPEEDLKSASHTATSTAGTAVSNAPRIVQYTGKGIQLAGKGVELTGQGLRALAPIPVVGWIAGGIGIGLMGAGKGMQVAGKGMEKGGQAAGKIKGGLGQAKGLGSVKSLASPSGLGSRLARFIPGPVGLALRIKDALEKLPFIGKYFKKAFDLGKKVAAGIAALIAYLLLMLAAKFAGLFAGLMFGAITGLPLLLLGPIGIPLYVAWVAYNGYMGFKDPFGTFSKIGNTWHAITHPWEILGKPLGFAKDAIASASSNIAVGVKGLVSGAGDLVGGAISTAGSVIGNFAGAAFGVIGNATNFLISGFGSLSFPSSIITTPLAVGLGTVGGGTLLVTAFIAPAAFFTAEGEGDLSSGPTGENQYFTITKTAQPTIIPRDLAVGETQRALFTITLTAKSSRLTSIQLSDEMRYQNSSGSNTISTDINGNPISPVSCISTTTSAPTTTLGPGESCTGKIEIAVTLIHNNSVINNTARVTATPDGQSPQTGSSTALITVGNPPTDDPSGWPTCGVISQGPYSLPSHNANNQQSSIDINNNVGTKVYATHRGTITYLGTDQNGGIYVASKGLRYWTFYVHLLSYSSSLSVGQTINAGTLIGLMGKTGTANLPHLHYMIRDINNSAIPLSTFNSLVPAYSLNGTVTSSWGPC